MAIPPSFSAGSVLTAAQMNKVGLWLVKTVDIPASPATTSLDVTSCFTSDYQNYRVEYAMKGNGTAVFHNLVLLAVTTPSATGYYRNGITMTSNSTTVQGNQVGNDTKFDLGAQQAGTELVYGSFEIMYPKDAAYTYIQGNSSTYVTGFGYNYTFQGVHTVATSYDGFRISVASGSFNTGKVRVYGYNNG